MSQPVFIDLFSGAGGLSLGLVRAGFKPLLAVEKSPLAAETYFRNFIDCGDQPWADHRSKSLGGQIAAGLAIAQASEVLGRIADVQALLGNHELDLLAGGPPCQGFSSAGLRDPSDQRNQLPYEFLRFVAVLHPKFVLIENVVGIGTRPLWTAVDTPLGQICRALRTTPPGYVALPIRVNAREFGVAQDRPRIVVLAARKDLAESVGEPWSVPQGAAQIPLRDWADMPGTTVTAPRGVHDALADLNDSGYVYGRKGEYPAALGPARHLRFSGHDSPPTRQSEKAPASPPNHVLRAHGGQAVSRFRLLLALRDHGITDDSTLWFPRGIHGDQGERLLDARVAQIVKRVSFPLEHDGVVVARSSEDLRVVIRSLATRKHSQRALEPDAPARTILSIPDDHVHFSRARTLTVRETARLQGFPDQFVFYGPATCGGTRRRSVVPQYTQVGNAVPPPLAHGVGNLLVHLLASAASVAVLEDSAEQRPLLSSFQAVDASS